MEYKGISAEDVARVAKVSQSTVSRAFTEGASISNTTKQKVLKVAEELNYHPNAFARGLINRESKIIGIAMKNVQNSFYAEVLNVFSKKLEEKGYNILFIATENDEIVSEDIKKFFEYNVAGIVITDGLLTSSSDYDITENIPVVLFNRFSSDHPYHSVTSENIESTLEIAEYFYKNNAKDILYVSGHPNASTNLERQTTFTSFFKNKNIEVKVLEGNFSYDTAYSEMKSYIERNDPPDAIFSANDITALGVLDALKENNVAVPEETMIIGFDNIIESSWKAYQLSTWEQPIEEMVDKTLEILLSKEIIHDQKNIRVLGKMIHRKTTLT